MFKGNTRAVFVDKREYTGPLWQQIEDAFQFVLRINLYRMVEEEGLSILKTNQATNRAADQTNQDTNQANQDTNQAIDQVSTKANWSDAELTDKDKAILLLIKNQPDITQKELASQLGWAIASVKYYMTKLKGQHVLKRLGNNQKGRWEILIR